MDANVTLDLGQNITGLIEKLATSIGTTAQQVFPWYVQQAYLHAAATICGFLVIWFIAAPVVFLLVRRALHPHEDDDDVAWAIMAIVSIVVFGILIGVGTQTICGQIPAIFNPEYAAMHQLIKDLSMLAGK